MARSLMIGFLLLIACLAKGQKVNQKSSDYNSKQFKNQGEQEEFWARQLFAKEYSKQMFQRYNGPIETKGDTLIYGKGSFVHWGVGNYISILSLGILYPEIIGGPKFEGELSISDFEELTALEISSHQKRFRFLFHPGTIANPTVYFIEVSNNNADKNTDLSTFLENGILTFFKKGWVGI